MNINAIRITRDNFYWIDLTPLWSMIEFVAQAREKQKRPYQSSRLMRGEKSTHLPGCAGEVIAAVSTGKEFDAGLYINGDNGKDFKDDGTDVKTVANYWPPILKHPVDSTKWPNYFELVFLDEQKKNGCVIGKVRAEDLREKGTIRNFGYADNYTLSMEQVVEMSVIDIYV